MNKRRIFKYVDFNVFKIMNTWLFSRSLLAHYFFMTVNNLSTKICARCLSLLGTDLLFKLYNL